MGFVVEVVVVIVAAVAVEECVGRELIEYCGRIDGGDLVFEELEGLSWRRRDWGEGYLRDLRDPRKKYVGVSLVAVLMLRGGKMCG